MILVDPAVWPWRGRWWAHLVSDRSLDELHRFAAELRLDPRQFGGDHYDISAAHRLAAIDLGAVPVDTRELVRRRRASGLRLTSRERQLAPRHW